MKGSKRIGEEMPVKTGFGGVGCTVLGMEPRALHMLQPPLSSCTSLLSSLINWAEEPR